MKSPLKGPTPSAMGSMRGHAHRLVVLAGACLLASACGGGSGGTEPAPRVSQLQVDGAQSGSFSLAVGESRTLSVQALDGAGEEIADAALEATSSNPGVASVSVAPAVSSGAALAGASVLVRGEEAGSATITFRHPPSGITADLPVTVTAAAPQLPPVIQLVPSTVSLTAVEGDPALLRRVVQISNGGGGMLTWSARDDAAWLSVAPSSGFGGGPLGLIVEPTASLTLPPDFSPRTATVTVSAPGAEPKTIEVMLTFAPPPPPPADVVVLVGNGNLTFSPAQLTIRRGTRVIWRWNDGELHSVTSFSLFGGGAPFDSTILQGSGREFSHVFNEPAGTVVTYHCRPHANPFLSGGHRGTVRITP